MLYFFLIDDITDKCKNAIFLQTGICPFNGENLSMRKEWIAVKAYKVVEEYFLPGGSIKENNIGTGWEMQDYTLSNWKVGGKPTLTQNSLSLYFVP